MPHGVSNAGSLNIANNGDSLLFVEVDQRQPDRDIVLRILIWTRFVDEQWKLHNLIASLSYLDVDSRINYYGGTDPDEIEDLLVETHVLIIPDQENGTEEQLSDIGRDFRSVLFNFLFNRSGYVVGLGSSGKTSTFLRSANLLDLELTLGDSILSCRAVSNHPINANVREYTALLSCNYHTCNDWDAIAISQLVGREENNITARSIGHGGVVYLGMNWWRYNDEMTQLLVNSVMWSQGGSNWLFIEPLDGVIESNSSEDLFFSIESRYTPEPGVYRKSIVLSSNDPDNPEISVPVTLTVSEWLPAEMRLAPEEIFLITDADVDTQLVVMIYNEGGGVLRASLELEHPDTTWLDINRNLFTIGPRLMDRVLLQFQGEFAEERVEQNRLIFRFANPDTVTVELPIIYYAGEDFGGIEGDLIDDENNQVVQDVIINLHGIQTVSDESGHFEFENIPPSSYNLELSHPEYIDVTLYYVRVRTDQITHLNERLHYCILESDFGEQVSHSIFPGVTGELIGEFRNTGNGLLSYMSHFRELIHIPNLQPWQVRSTIYGGDLTPSTEIYGAVFNGEHLILSGNGGRDYPNSFYFFNREGELVETIEQPGEFVRGMAGLAWDGELIYGTDWGDILGVNLDGEIVTRIPGPYYFCRAITWDEENELFWVADARNDIIGINRDGDRLITIENPGLFIYGLAWRGYSEDGFNLYMFCRDGPSNAQINQVQPETGIIRFVTNLPAEGDERAGGIAVTSEWESRFWSIITQYVGGSNRTTVYNLDMCDDWVRLIPPTGDIPPGGSLPVTFEFNSRNARIDDELEGYFIIDAQQRGGVDTLRVIMSVVKNSVEEEVNSGLSPDDFALTAYPNPFNNQLTVLYRTAAQTTDVRISIYDLQGRLVQTVTPDKNATTGGRVILDASRMGSGLYFLLLEGGQTRIIRRVVLLK